ncbi:MAG: efflux RND transporter periplasmic adaptor subunit [Candidatus Yonathbacteria bacterium]|nr:efflux RND transporter periplasmic adaptor subunit [Candidatus Yonathbacteria bacterium]
MNPLNIFSKKQIIWATVILVAVAIGLYFISGKKTSAPQNTAKVLRGNITQEVSVTGRVKAVTTVDLGFEKTGRIQNVYVKVGDHVEQGALLAEIESSTAQAALQEADARLAELKRGSRPEEIAVKEAELAKYTQDLTNAYSGVPDTSDDAFTKTDDAIHSKIAGTFSGFKTSSYKLTFPVCDTQLDVNTAWLRYTTEIDIDLWRTERTAFPVLPTQNDLKNTLDGTAQHLEKTRAFLESLNRALTLDCTITNTGLDTYRANVNTARTNISTAIAAVNTKGQTIASLALTVAKVRNELSLLRAGTASEVVAAQEARVLSAQGELRKLKIYAPINGTVTKVDAITGEFANIATPLLSIISDSSFEMDAYVPEADIAKIKIGDTARVTLDAYGSDVLLSGRVFIIDPAETIIDNVPTYKATLHFAKDDVRIKSGMTANIDIATNARTNVLYLPSRAVITKDGRKFVTVLNADNTTTETPVTTGLKGSDGLVEILSGVNEGNLILVSSK